MTGDLVIDALRLALAAMFAVAGVAKLADLSGATQAAQDFGAPQRLARPTAVLLSCAEIAIAGGLLVGTTARSAAVAGATLLIVLAAAVAIARLRGRTPDCHCFGRLHLSPAGWGIAARNVGIAVVALLLASQPPAGIGADSVAAFAVVAAIAAQASLWIALLRRYGAALRRIDKLEAENVLPAESEIGTPAPPFALPTTADTEVALEDLLEPGLPALLVFVDTGCGACSALLPSLSSASDAFTLAVLGHGDPDRLRATADEHGLDEILVVPDFSLFRAYGSEATPSAVLVDADGLIASPLLYGAEDITDVLGGYRGQALEVAA